MYHIPHILFDIAFRCQLALHTFTHPRGAVSTNIYMCKFSQDELTEPYTVQAVHFLQLT